MTDIQPSATPPAAAQARHGLSPRTVAEIGQCLRGFPQIHWVKLYGSRAMGSHWDSLRYAPLKEHIDRVGVPFP